MEHSLQAWLPLLSGLSLLILVYGGWTLSAARRLANQTYTQFEPLSTQRERRPPFLLALERKLEATPPVRRLRQLLVGADLDWSLFTVLLVGLGLCLVLTVVTAAVFQLSWRLNIAFSGPAAVGILIFYLYDRQGVRERALQAQTPEIALLLSNSLSAGLSLYQALNDSKGKLPSPAADELRKLVQQIDLGQPTEDALQQFLARHPGENMRILITALLIQREAGGNLVKTLASISSAVLSRQRVVQEVQTITTQARYTSLLLMVLPLGVLALLNILMQGAVSEVINETAWGFWFFLGVYIAPQVAAQWLIRQVSNVQV